MTHERSDLYAKIAVVLLLVVLFVLGYFLVRQYRITMHEGAVTAARLHFTGITKHRPLGASDVSLIASWMTFDYVSVSYKVPVSYLSAALDIQPLTAGFPNITIGRYARAAATSSAAIVEEVQAAVQSYLSPQAGAPATSTPPTGPSSAKFPHGIPEEV